jgi:hypothetical protein
MTADLCGGTGDERQRSLAALRIPVLTDELLAPYRQRARRCGIFIIAQQMRRKGFPLELAVEALARKETARV